MKKCSKCNENKDLNLFSASSKSKDKLRSQCKLCDKKYRESLQKNELEIYRREYYKKNKEILNKKNTHYFIKNKEKIKEQRLNYRKENKEKIRIKSKSYYDKNKEILSIKSKKYAQENKKILIEKSRLRRIERKKTDNAYNLKCNIRRLIQLSFKSKGHNKNTKTFEILGCNSIFFKNYIESKFEYWMNWDNKGLYNGNFYYGWDLDHIIPLNTAKTKEEIIKLNHYTNIQPLCSKINREIKKDNIWKMD